MIRKIKSGYRLVSKKTGRNLGTFKTLATMNTGMSHVERAYEGLSNDWWTPSELVAALGPFDLDPCSGEGQIPLARYSYTPPQDGLSLPWMGRVFCNPPYGPHTKKWVERMILWENGILLIFARTETRTWQKIWAAADGVLFKKGRIAFQRPDGSRVKSGTAPSAFVAFGAHNVDALRESGISGALVTKVELID